MANNKIDELRFSNVALSRSANEAKEALNAETRSIEKQEETLKRADKSLSSFLNKHDELTRTANKLRKAEEELANTLKRVENARAKGPIDEEALTRGIADLEGKIAFYKKQLEALGNPLENFNHELEKQEKTARLSSYQLGNLTAEAHKFLDQILAGGSAFKAGFFQFPNMITTVGGLRNAVSLLTSPLALTAGAIATTGLALGGAAKYAYDNEKRFAQLSLKLRATRHDYLSVAHAAESVSRTFARQTGNNLSESREVIHHFASNPLIPQAHYMSLAKASDDVAALMGTSLPDASRKLGEAFKAPAKAAEDFASQGLFNIHRGFVLQLQDMENSGHALEATARLFDQIKESSKGAAEQGLAPLAKEWLELKKTLPDFHEGLDQMANWSIKAARFAIKNTVFGPMLNDIKKGQEIEEQKKYPVNGTEENIREKQADKERRFALQKFTIDNALSGSNSSIFSQRREEMQWIEKITSGLKSLDEQRDEGKISLAEYGNSLRELNERLAAHQASLLNLKTPFEEISQQHSRQIQLAKASSEVQKAYVSAENEAEEAAQKMGRAHASVTEILEARKRAQGLLTASFKSSIKATNDNAEAELGLLKSFDANKSSVSDLLINLKALEMARAHAVPGTKEFSHEVEKSTEALKKETLAASLLNLNENIHAQSLQLDLLKKEGELIGQNADKRRLEISLMKTRQELSEKGISSLRPEYNHYLKNSRDITQKQLDNENKEKANTSFTSSINQAAEAISTAFTNAASQGSLNFKNAFAGFSTQAGSFFTRHALLNPGLNLLDGGSRDTAFSIGRIFDRNSYSSSSDGGFFSKSRLASVGNGIGLGMGAGSMTSLIGGNQTGGMIGSGIGATIGGIGGSFLSFLGPAGASIGGTVVGALGGLLGSLFGRKKANWDQIIGQNGQLSIGSSYSKRVGDVVRDPLQKGLSQLNSLLEDNAVNVANGSYGEVGFTRKNGKTTSRIELKDILGNLNLSSPDALQNRAMTSLMPSKFDSVEEFSSTLSSIHSLVKSLEDLHISVKSFDDLTHTTIDHFDGYTGDLEKALNNTLGDKKWNNSELVSKANAIITFVNQTEKSLLDVTSSGTTSMTQQVKDLQEKYKKAADQAQSYGLDAQKFINKGQEIADSMWRNAENSLDSNNSSVSTRYLVATGDEQGAALSGFDMSAAAQRSSLKEAWRNFLGDACEGNQDYLSQLANLEKTLAAERLEIQKNYQGKSIAQEKSYHNFAQQTLASQFSSLADYVRGLGTSNASPLSVQRQLATANDNFNSDFNKAQNGDADALSRIQNDSQTYLEKAKQYHGSGVDYAKAYQDVVNKLATLSNADTEKLTKTIMEKLSQQQIDASKKVKEAVDNVKQAIEDLKREQHLTNLTQATRAKA